MQERQEPAEEDSPPSSFVGKAESAAAPAAKDDERPVVVQRTGAKPFWRLTGNDAGRHSAIEIVIPEGVELGEPSGHDIPFLDGSHLELPVTMNPKDCVFLTGDTSSERVLKCNVLDSSVTKVNIQVDDEL